MLFQVSSEGWSWPEGADCACAFGGPAKQSTAIKGAITLENVITLENIDMVEFHFHRRRQRVYRKALHAASCTAVGDHATIPIRVHQTPR
jgi:hypothetical protein